MINKEKILITGGTGFLGKNLILSLLQEGYPVVSLSRKSLNIVNKNLVQIIGDIKNNSYLSELPKNIDIIIHTVQSDEYQKNLDGAQDMFDVNVKSTFDLINWAAKNQVKKFIYTSSGSVYLDRSQPNNETSTCEPTDFYSASKLCSENLLRPFSKIMDICIFRIYSLFGLHQKNKIIPNLFNKIQSKELIKLDSMNGMIFNPLHIDNCLNVIHQEILKESKFSIRIFNLAGIETISLEDLINELASFIKINPIIKKVDSNNKIIVGNIDLLNKNYDIGNFYSIRESIQKSFT